MLDLVTALLMFLRHPAPAIVPQMFTIPHAQLYL